MIGFPFLAMALSKSCNPIKSRFIPIREADIIVQPTRFEIVEELGCSYTIYSYIGYLTYFGPQLTPSLGCALLAREYSFCNSHSCELTLIFGPSSDNAHVLAAS